MNFPDRTTECGALINSFLTNKQEFDGETIHLLFTINRWEAMKKMEKLLKDGVTLIVDRYSYSGVAFSAAKGLDLEWCKAPEKGLLKPDLVFLLDLPSHALANRGGFGDERYVTLLMDTMLLTNSVRGFLSYAGSRRVLCYTKIDTANPNIWLTFTDTRCRSSSNK